MSKQPAQHSPLPWSIRVGVIVDSTPDREGKFVGQCPTLHTCPEYLANATLIVTAVNAHAGLVEERDEALATIARLERDKDHLLTKADGDYLRQRLGEMAALEAQRDGLVEALRAVSTELENVYRHDCNYISRPIEDCLDRAHLILARNCRI